MSCGDTELVAAVRAAREEMGPHSILTDFNLWCFLALTSDLTAATGMVQRLWSGNARHVEVGDRWVEHKVR